MNKEQSLTSNFSPLQVGSVTEFVESLSASSPISWAVSLLDDNPRINALPIERDGIIIGLLDARVIRELNESSWRKFWQRDLDAYVSTPVVGIDAWEYVEKVLPKVLKENEEHGTAHFVVYYRRSYLGIVSLDVLINQATLLRNQDMERAREVQQNLLAHDRVHDPRIDCKCFIRMAHEVGGDFYQNIAFDNNRMLLACFDVSGKNLAASLTTTGIGAFFSALKYFGVNESNRSSELTPKMNAYLRDLVPGDTFIAAVLFFVDFTKKTMEIQNLGYSPVFAFVPGGPKVSCKILKPNLAPLGLEMYDEEKVSVYTLPLVEGLRIFAFSDGFTDLENSDQIKYGDTRAKDFILKHHADPLDDVIAAATTEIENWQGKALQKDDITLFALEIAATGVRE